MTSSDFMYFFQVFVCVLFRGFSCAKISVMVLGLQAGRP